MTSRGGGHETTMLEIEATYSPVLRVRVGGDARSRMCVMDDQWLRADCDLPLLTQPHPEIQILCGLELRVKTADIFHHLGSAHTT